MPRDYYDVLGISRAADPDEIKSAFRKLARRYHPDVSQEADAESKFKEINEAYGVLSDEEQRARYDQFGHAGVNGAGPGFGGFNVQDFGDIFDIFNTAFGGAATSRRRGPQPGRDLRADVSISFLDAVTGVEKEIEIRRLEVCDDCDGQGAAAGTRPVTCPQCNGSGQMRRRRQTLLGAMLEQVTCPQCGGRGAVIQTPCRNCDGSGRRRQRAVHSVKIPPGVSDGTQIQLRGAGDAGEIGAPPGNLRVAVHVREHEYFEREGNDILLDIDINVAQAALGDQIEVETVDGAQTVKLPPGTQTGKVFRLRGKGFPRLRSDGSTAGRGDQLVEVRVVTPTELNERQRELFEELSESFGQDRKSRPDGRGIVNKMMDFLAGDD